MNLRDMVKTYARESATATTATVATPKLPPVAGLATVAVATEQSEKARLAVRWHWFLSLAAEHGVDACVVSAEFSKLDDRLDVIEPTEHNDDSLRACMATLCRDVRVQKRQRDYANGLWVPAEHEL